MIVFDADEWHGKDKGDNSQFWKPALIVKVYTRAAGEELAHVKFVHDGRLSKGHFTAMMRRPEE